MKTFTNSVAPRLVTVAEITNVLPGLTAHDIARLVPFPVAQVEMLSDGAGGSRTAVITIRTALEAEDMPRLLRALKRCAGKRATITLYSNDRLPPTALASGSTSRTRGSSGSALGNAGDGVTSMKDKGRVFLQCVVNNDEAFQDKVTTVKLPRPGITMPEKMSRIIRQFLALLMIAILLGHIWVVMLTCLFDLLN